jgi:hypothetical protein
MAEAEAKTFSLKDVATHNSNKSSWIVIHNNVRFRHNYTQKKL